MNENPLCPVCGTPGTADAPQGLCPECLMRSASAPESAGAPAGEPTDYQELPHQALAPEDYTLSIGSCLRRGWGLVFGDFWALVGITLLILVIRTLALSTFVGVVVSGPLTGGLYLHFLKKIRGEETSLSTAFSGFTIAFFPLFLGSVISSILEGIGFLFLLLPGLYLMIAWLFTLVLIVDKQIGFWEAMGLSRKTISKHWFKFFGLFMVLVLLNMVGAVVFFVGTLITIPVSLAALMFAYEDIFGSSQQRAEATEEVPGRSNRLLAWSVAGLVVFLVIAGLAFRGLRHVTPKKINIIDATESTNGFEVIEVIQVTNEIPENPSPAPSRKSVASQTTQAIDPTPSNSFDDPLLNADQKLALRYMNLKVQQYDEQRTFDDSSSSDRARLEIQMIETLNGSRTDAYFQAINTLAALHSTVALPLLRRMAFDHEDKLIRLETSNRPRWMAVRAMGIIGDKAVVPDIIHLLYHNNSYVRWSAQIALVRLTGQNFGKDWLAWGNWWSEQKNNPPFNSTVVHWWRGQAAPDQLEKELAENDQNFLDSMQSKKAKKRRSAR